MSLHPIVAAALTERIRQRLEASGLIVDNPDLVKWITENAVKGLDLDIYNRKEARFAASMIRKGAFDSALDAAIGSDDAPAETGKWSSEIDPETLKVETDRENQ